MNFTEDYEDYEIFSIPAKWVKITCTVLVSPMIVLGVLGNLLTFMVFLTRERRKSSFSIYLSALAIADILVLTIPAIEFWLMFALHRYIRRSFDSMCKTFAYLAYVLPCVSAWILVAVSTERMLGVCAPVKMNILSKPKHALLVVAAMTVAVSAIFSPLLLGSSLEKSANMPMCDLDGSTILTQEALSTLDLTFFFAAPFMIMLINNTIIIIKLAGCIDNYCRKSEENKTFRNSPRHQKVLRTITRRVIILCVIYMTCNAPLMILNVIWKSTNDKKALNWYLMTDLNFLFHILMYLNNSVNFLLYCVIGSSFRNDFLKMMSSFIRKLRTLYHFGA